MGFDHWNMAMISMESDAFMEGCADARNRSYNGDRYKGDYQGFAEYACGWESTLEDMLGEEINNG